MRDSADGADLPQRAVAAAVVDGGARRQPLQPHLVEREVHQRDGAFDEQARAPEFGPEDESPFSRLVWA